MRHNKAVVLAILVLSLAETPRAVQHVRGLAAAAQNRMAAEWWSVVLSLPSQTSGSRETRTPCRSPERSVVEIADNRGMNRDSTTDEMMSHGVNTQSSPGSRPAASPIPGRRNWTWRASTADSQLVAGESGSHRASQNPALAEKPRQGELVARIIVDPDNIGDRELAALKEPVQVKAHPKRDARVLNPVMDQASYLNAVAHLPFARTSDLEEAVARSVSATKAAVFKDRAFGIQFKLKASEATRTIRRGARSCGSAVKPGIFDGASKI